MVPGVPSEILKNSSNLPISPELLSDPQTSSGLLVSCSPGVVAQVLQIFHTQSFAEAAAASEVRTGSGVNVY